VPASTSALIPLYADKRLVGSIAALQSKELVQKNTWEMVRILGLIAAACLLIIAPVAWYFSNTVARPAHRVEPHFSQCCGR